MINAEITYGQGSFIAKVKGHAGLAPVGQDIVCAGVSALSMALHKAVTGCVTREDASYFSVEINDGCFEIRVLGIRDSEAGKRLEAFFAMFFDGLFEIEKEYPDCLKLNTFEFPFGDNDNDTSEQTMKNE